MSNRKLNMPRFNDYAQMSNVELQEALKELRFVNMSGRGNATAGRVPNAGALRQTRIAIARILTIMQQRGIRAT